MFILNTARNNLQLPWLSLGLVLLLIVFAPYAMSFPPYPPYISTDSLQPRRVALVILGLSATIASFTELLAVAVRNRRQDLIGIAPFAAVFLACAVVGWRSYPYWATGVYQVDIGAFPPMDQDPKDMMPMIWIGELWRLPVVLLELICFVAVPILLGVAIRGLRQRRFAASVTITLCIGIVLIAIFGFSHEYMVWLMD